LQACAKSYIILVSDGEPTSDNPCSSGCKTFGCNNPASDCTPITPTLYPNFRFNGSGYLDDIAFKLFTEDNRTDIGNDPGPQNVAIYTLFVFEQSETSKEIMQRAAIAGGFSDLNADGQTDSEDLAVMDRLTTLLARLKSVPVDSSTPSALITATDVYYLTHLIQARKDNLAVATAQQEYDTAKANKESDPETYRVKTARLAAAVVLSALVSERDAAAGVVTTKQLAFDTAKVAFNTAQTKLTEKSNALEIAKTEYDAAVNSGNQANIDAAQAKLNTAQSEFDGAQSDYNTKKTQYDTAKSELVASMSASESAAKLQAFAVTVNNNRLGEFTNDETIDAADRAKVAASVSREDTVRKADLNKDGKVDGRDAEGLSNSIRYMRDIDRAVLERVIELEEIRKRFPRSDVDRNKVIEDQDAELIRKAPDHGLQATGVSRAPGQVGRARAPARRAGSRAPTASGTRP